jgi:hypothetical protein
LYYQHKRPAQWVSEQIFSAVKGPKLEANLSRHSSDEVKNEQLFISISHTLAWSEINLPLLFTHYHKD